MHAAFYNFYKYYIVIKALIFKYIRSMIIFYIVEKQSFCRKIIVVVNFVECCRTIVANFLQYNLFIVNLVEYVEYVERSFTRKKQRSL